MLFWHFDKTRHYGKNASLFFLCFYSCCSAGKIQWPCNMKFSVNLEKCNSNELIRLSGANNTDTKEDKDFICICTRPDTPTRLHKPAAIATSPDLVWNDRYHLRGCWTKPGQDCQWLVELFASMKPCYYWTHDWQAFLKRRKKEKRCGTATDITFFISCILLPS